MNLLLITGGKHPYEESTPILHAFLEEAGHSITLSESAIELSGDLSAFDAIVLNTLRQEATDNDLNDSQREGFEGYVAGGGSLLSVHISAASCPDWSQTKKITGGGWVLGESWHPPFGWFEVTIDQTDHPITAGVSKTFWTYDECYCGLDIQPGIDVFMHGVVEDDIKPLGWTHQFGAGKVVNIALGHAASSQQHPQFQKLILNALNYLS
ncbi:MAG: ThuA domain-containing protein [Chloroflexi bacterium]|nr:ThuA domain-containing protein [Chloroflexota bacterium]MDA1281705.1 ThuA domain-containing protein [Chloroflexota bacterium]